MLLPVLGLSQLSQVTNPVKPNPYTRNTLIVPDNTQLFSLLTGDPGF